MPAVALCGVALLIGGLPVAAAAQPAAPAARPGVTAAAQARVDAQRPLVEAAERLQQAVERHRWAGFTSIVLAADAVEVYGRGTPPAAVRAAAEAERVPVTFKPAAYSRTTLKLAEKALMAYVAKHPASDVYGVRVPADGRGLVAQSRTKPTGGLLDRLRREAPDDATSVALAAEQAEPPAVAERQDDRSPFAGGAELRTPGGGTCSTAFGVRDDAGDEFMLTAGHCGNDEEVFRTGDRQEFGTAEEEHVGHDILLIRADTRTEIWDGGGRKRFETRGQFTKRVGDWSRNAFAGQWVCQSGKVSGAVCDLRNTDNLSFSYRSSSGEVYSDLVVAQRTAGVAVRNGDSGGPVFMPWDTEDAVTVTGVISGRNSYPFRVALNGKCLDADANNLNVDGTRVQLWDCNGTVQQRWAMYSDGSIRSATNGGRFCLDADTNTADRNGTVLQLWTCNREPQQRWIHPGDGSAEVRSDLNGRCIDADPAQAGRNGGRVYLWDCNGTPQQGWGVTGSRIYYQDLDTVVDDFDVEPITS